MLTILYLCFFQLLQYQPAVPAEPFIVQLIDEQEKAIVKKLSESGIDYSLKRISSTDYYRLTLPVERNPDEILTQWKKEGLLSLWQHDRPVVPRNTPNDPLFPNQWDMTRIGMQEAWNQTIGGVTENGDTIVVAILDTGFDVDHEDLTANTWINKAEIPGDGVDNDQNGYIDDYRGVNVRTGNGTHPEDKHGTSVAGIIGARGGNNKGICGVNWQVKLLFISGIQNESDIIEGYAYSKALRDKYRNSGGTQGAFIVATNLSAGIDNALPEDHQLWCDQYGFLGSAGILSVCSTTNANTDVDEEGDMPTTCPSEYMIAVTNTGMNDMKLTFAGYGAVHIDLAAPGTPTLTTDVANGYDDFEGTSAAAPHVTGAIALLYAAACSDVLDIADADPGALALQVKNLILDNVDPIASLEAITLAGGRMNVAKSIGALVGICDSSGGDLEIIRITPNPVFDEAVVEYNIPDLNPYTLSLYDSVGRLIFEEKLVTAIPGLQYFTLPAGNLIPGVYHFSINHKDNIVSKSLLVQ